MSAPDYLNSGVFQLRYFLNLNFITVALKFNIGILCSQERLIGFKDVAPQWRQHVDRDDRLVLGAEQLQADNQAHRGRLQVVERPDHADPGARRDREELRAQPEDLVQEVERPDREGSRVRHLGGGLQGRPRRGRPPLRPAHQGPGQPLQWRHHAGQELAEGELPQGERGVRCTGSVNRAFHL